MSAGFGSWTARRRPVHAIDSMANRSSDGPRFERFTAAMEAAPPPEAQILPEAEAPGPAKAEPESHKFARPATPPPGPKVVPPAAVASPPPERPTPSEPADDHPILTRAADGGAGRRTDDAGETVTPRRPVIESRSRGDIPWLGIGSWVLFCGALFVSLLGWPDQTALDRVTGLWSSYYAETIATEPPEAGGGQSGPTAALEQPVGPREDFSAMSQGTDALEPAEVAPVVQPRLTRVPGGPPVPQFKPNVDGVAAKFSNAFFEIGDRLQRQGDFDAALHMRRQGSKLDPWKPTASDS